MAGAVQFQKRLEKMEEAIRALELTPHARKTVRIVRELDESDAAFETKKAAEIERLGVDPDLVNWWIRRIVEPDGIPIETVE